MINVSNDFKEQIYEGNIKYIKNVDVTLNSGTTLHIKDSDIWQGGLTIEDAVSNDNTFDIGAAIINQCTIVLNNIYDNYSEYDFDNATVVPFIGLELPDGTTESFRKGTFHVTDTKYNGALITLTCLDNMDKFDKEYSKSTLQYPAKVANIVKDACNICGVSLSTINIPHGDFVVQERPNAETTTFREIIQWCAQIAGCFCRCDVFGKLELKWYDQDLLMKIGLDGGYFDDDAPYSSGDNADGGLFLPWRDYYSFDGGTFDELAYFHHIYSNYSCEISTNDVVITGVKVVEKNSEDSETAITTYQYGEEGYVISIENNDLIQNGSGDQISKWIGQQLTGFRFRKATVQHTSNPTIEAGDIGFLTDKNQNTYPIIISSTTYSSGGSQKTSSSAETPSKTNVARYSQTTKNYVTSQEQAKKASGLYETLVEQPDGSTIRYYHDKRKLEDSSIQMVFNTDGFQITGDGGAHWYGMKVDGDFIANILSATGIIADWIVAGRISDKEGKSFWDLDTGQMELTGDFTQNNIDGTKAIDIRNATLNVYSNRTKGLVVGSVGLTGSEDDESICVYCMKEKNVSIGYSNDTEPGKRIIYLFAKFTYKNGTPNIIFYKIPEFPNAKTGRAVFSDGSYLDFTNGILTGGQTASGGQIT